MFCDPQYLRNSGGPEFHRPNKALRSNVAQLLQSVFNSAAQSLFRTIVAFENFR